MLGTNLFACFYVILRILGMTVGGHRLWAHRSFEANFFLRLNLMLMNSMACQCPVISWARDHRCHHKFRGTDADPYNASRGFFFSHIGWALVRKHPDVIREGKKLDLSDLTNDRILVFQKKYYHLLSTFMCFVLPTLIPFFAWGETILNGFLIPGALGHVVSLHLTWLINSAAHISGVKPYDKSIRPVESEVISMLTLGEGSQNYHHAFPWDYRAAESNSYTLNWTLAFIDGFARLGCVKKRKVATENMVKLRVQRKGDGSHTIWRSIDN